MNRLFQKLLAPTDLADFEPENYHNYQTYFAIANFLPERNVIRFSASMLQPPFFHKAFPKAMNYGAIGSTIGHEFTHGFDDEGSERDDQGYYKVWWTQETQANFLKQKQCIIDQYSAFRVPEMNMNVNGSHTAAENLADNGGLKEAYMAYHTYLKKLGHEEERLRGYENYSNDQLFFIGFGARQCVKMTKKVLSWHLVGDPHALGRFRVNGVVSNSPEFAAAFKCPTGSPMNPVKKCRVW